ncbi:MAG: asparagine synthetase B family protein, partial [Tepidisphaeraceae bacterium]
MRLSATGMSVERYWDPNDPPDDEALIDQGPESDLVLTTRRLVTDSVRRRLVADVPLGCFLSGGIDSSIIAAAMKASVGTGQEVLTFSIGFDDPHYDETGYAGEVAAHLGTTHRQFTVRPDAAVDLPRLAEVFGEPFGDSSALPTHYLSRETRCHVKVALSGDGGDELFGGYDRYRAMALGERVRALPWPLSSIAESDWWQELPGTHPKSLWSRLKRFLGSLPLSPESRYASYLRITGDDALADVLNTTAFRGFNEPTAWVVDHYRQMLARDDRDVVSAALATDRLTYLPEDLLTKVDRCSMLHALEVRSPFMDPGLVRFAATLDAPRLIRGGPKRLLRQAFAPDLPPGVFSRRKMGFAVPIGQWLRGELRQMFHDLVLGSGDSFTNTYLGRGAVETMWREHAERTADHSQALYALLMLELWWARERVVP